MTSRARRAEVADSLAGRYGGVMHRRDLERWGVGCDDVAAEIRAGRWAAAGRCTVVRAGQVPNGPGHWWRAVWESGEGAVLDGAASLVASGMTGFQPDRIDVAVLKGRRRHTVAGVHRHERRELGPVARGGVPRTGAAWATIRAAQWARSDRQAALLVCLPVQQRLLRPELLVQAWGTVLRSPRRAFLDQVIADVVDGAHSLGELDFGRLCRRHTLPGPRRQQLRVLSGRHAYLDVSWDDVPLVVEIDGSHHVVGAAPVADALRQNEIALLGETVIRIPLLGLRTHEAEFMAQVGAGLRRFRR